MMVGGHGLFDPPLFHHGERGAIGERPFQSQEEDRIGKQLFHRLGVARK